MSAAMTEQQLAEIGALVANARAMRFVTGLNAATGHFDTPVERELYTLAGRCWNALQPQLKAADTLLAEVERLTARVAELETVATEARAALGALCYDLEDPGSNALGALHLLTQATVWVDKKPDDAIQALAKRDAWVLRSAAESLEAVDGDDDIVNFLYSEAQQTERAAAAVAS